MSATFLALLLRLGDGMEGVRRALSGADFRMAWSLMELESDPVTRARMEAEILYGAGDPARALAAARGGLERSPEQLELLYHAAGAAIWLQDAGSAEPLSALLARAVDASIDLSPAERTSWRRVASGFVARSAELRRHEFERQRAVERARMLALAGLVLGLALSGLVFRRG